MKLDWETVLGNINKNKKEKSAYTLSPSDAYSVMNAFSPYDLLMKPTDLPLEGLLPETAFNVQSIGDAGVPNTNIIYPNDYSDLENQGILGHENVHAQSLPVDKPNQGYITFAGIPGNRGIAEKNAMQGEDFIYKLASILGK